MSLRDYLPSEKMEMRGHKVGLGVWAPFSKAPRTGRHVIVMRKSRKIEHARFAFGSWWARSWGIYWKHLQENDVSDPVTHYQENA
jgi:hypothetical protein